MVVVAVVAERSSQSSWRCRRGLYSPRQGRDGVRGARPGVGGVPLTTRLRWSTPERAESTSTAPRPTGSRPSTRCRRRTTDRPRARLVSRDGPVAGTDGERGQSSHRDRLGQTGEREQSNRRVRLEETGRVMGAGAELAAKNREGRSLHELSVAGSSERPFLFGANRGN